MEHQNSTDGSPRLEELARSLAVIDAETQYYAATLHKSTGEVIIEFFTRWAGFPDGKKPGDGIELRRAVPVDPENYSKIWDYLDQGWITVNSLDGLAMFMSLGGNAFIAEDIARQFFAVDLEPHACVQSNSAGFLHFNPNAREVKKHRPTPNQRKRILKRDNYRCKRCGREFPEDDTIGLHIHHIKPFSQGGLTIDENLISLCYKCHGRLRPHSQPELFLGPGSPAKTQREKETAATHEGGIEGHRQRVTRLLSDWAQRSNGRGQQ